VTGPGSDRLQTLEGEDISNSWNIDSSVDSTPSLHDYSGGSSLYDYSKTPLL
jgi:hypothetical protein